MWKSSIAAATFNLCTNSMVDKEIVSISFPFDCLETQSDRQSRVCDPHSPARDTISLCPLERLSRFGGAFDLPIVSNR